MKNLSGAACIFGVTFCVHHCDQVDLLGRWAQEFTSKRLAAKPLPAADEDTVLTTIGDILTDVHTRFYKSAAHTHTVPDILSTLKPKYRQYRCWALTGVYIVFR